VLDELYEKQSARSTRGAQKGIRDFERRLLDARSTISTRCSGTGSSRQREMKGWTVTPSHYLNQQLDAVWLTE